MDNLNKFAGVGLSNIFIIWLVCTIFTLIAKTLVIKYNAPDGVKDMFLAA